MTLIAILPVLGRGNGRLVVLYKLSHASSSISARRAQHGKLVLSTAR